MNNKMKYFLGEFLELQPRVDIPFLLLKSGGGFFNNMFFMTNKIKYFFREFLKLQPRVDIRFFIGKW